MPPEHYPRTQQILRNSVLVYSSSGISDLLLEKKPQQSPALKEKTTKTRQPKRNRNNDLFLSWKSGISWKPRYTIYSLRSCAKRTREREAEYDQACVLTVRSAD